MGDILDGKDSVPVGDGISGSFRKAKKPLTPSPLAPLSLFGSVSNSKLIWSHMIVFFEAFIKMSCISKM